MRDRMHRGCRPGLRALDPTDESSARRAARLARLRDAVRTGRYRPPPEDVAEALAAWLVPDVTAGPSALAWVP